MNMKLIILGAPGSGKGTTATVLREKYSLAHISTGDIFRANIKNGTPLGLEAKSYIDSGALVPDSVTIRMVEDRLSQDDTKNGYILDGFPRTLAQAEALDEILAKNGSSIDAVLSIVVDDEIIKDRVSSRRVCEKCGASYNVRFKPTKVEGVCDECGGKVIQRADDVPETVAARLETYYKNTKPLIDFYEGRGLIVEGDNGKSSEDCLKQIEEGLKVKDLI
jgi:adenylate kinase